jgi:AraC family transcriptional regulator
LMDSLHLSGNEVEWLLFKINQELQQARFATPAMVEALTTALAVALVRHFGLERVEAQRRAGGLAPWRVRLIRERVYADHPAPSLSELAELCGVSVRHLSRAFKAETGRTIVKFVEEAMVERAREMLSTDDLPIGQIARNLGFSSSANFACAFRRATGMRPSEVGRRGRSTPRRPGS